jgi:hypothetical protein
MVTEQGGFLAKKIKGRKRPVLSLPNNISWSSKVAGVALSQQRSRSVGGS